MTIEEVNYSNIEEVLSFFTSQGFMKLVSQKVDELLEPNVLKLTGFKSRGPAECAFAYGEFHSFYRVAFGRFRTPQYCMRNINSKQTADAFIQALALEAFKSIQPLLEAISRVNGSPAILATDLATDPPISIRWQPWNQYDALCNPEMIKPFYKMDVKITWQVPNEDQAKCGLSF